MVGFIVAIKALVFACTFIILIDVIKSSKTSKLVAVVPRIFVFFILYLLLSLDTSQHSIIY